MTTRSLMTRPFVVHDPGMMGRIGVDEYDGSEHHKHGPLCEPAVASGGN